MSNLRILNGEQYKVLFKSGENNVVAECTMCKKHIRGSSTSSSNFLSHLKRIHGDLGVEKYNQTKNKLNSTENNFAMKKDEAASVEENATDYLSEAGFQNEDLMQQADEFRQVDTDNLSELGFQNEDLIEQPETIRQSIWEASDQEQKIFSSEDSGGNFPLKKKSQT